MFSLLSCNSTYRLRYWNLLKFYQQQKTLHQVATVLTVYGIETKKALATTFNLLFGCNSTYRLRYWNSYFNLASTILESCNSTYRLRYWNVVLLSFYCLLLSPLLQQYLPFTVLKRWLSVRLAIVQISCNSTYRLRYWNTIKTSGSLETSMASVVATVLTVYGIETWNVSILICFFYICCNSTYRLRYWNLLLRRRPSLKLLLVATVLTVYGIETGQF